MQGIRKKLQIKPNLTFLLINAPDDFAAAMAAEGYSCARGRLENGAKGNFDAVQLFTKDKAELEMLFPQVVEALKKNGLLWIAYPKKSSKVKSDLTRDEGWKVVFDMGYEGVRQIAIDETWSSLRFRHKSERAEPSRMGAEYPGINKETRTVTPPEDMQKALDEAGLNEKFQKLAFTHKKEYVVAVLEAKRAETRTNRISNTIEQVLNMDQKNKV